MPEPTQNYQNHTRADYLHMSALIILVANVCVVTVAAVRLDLVHFSWMTILWIAIAFATVVIGLKARTNPIRVQDRVIRLEERIRYATILPTELATSAEALNLKQIVALRFAADPELPNLIARTLKESLTPKQIKASITNWRPDHLRV